MLITLNRESKCNIRQALTFIHATVVKSESKQQKPRVLFGEDNVRILSGVADFQSSAVLISSDIPISPLALYFGPLIVPCPA